jgi:hypothetical protein
MNRFRSLGALAAILSTACGDAGTDAASSGAGGGGGTGAGAGGGADPACIENGDAICTLACDCDASAGCSVEYPSGSSQQFSSHGQCASAFESWCAELQPGLIDPAQCAEDLQTAACIDVFDRQAVAIPDSCFVSFPDPKPECVAYSEASCLLACDCSRDELCYLSTDGAGWIAFSSRSSCEQDLLAACELEQTGVTDYETCLADLDGATCSTLGETQGLVLPPSCR